MSINKVILLGNVGRDPEIKHLEGGNLCASFPLATTERGHRTKNGTEVPEKTEWHNIVAWQSIAERIERQVRKGALIYIEGKLRTRCWIDQNNGKHYVTEIFADQFEFLRPANNQPPSNQPIVSDPDNERSSSDTAIDPFRQEKNITGSPQGPCHDKAASSCDTEY